ncbi:MAG: transporter substrate-binding domain-containing protein [Betaproteobacteria bacterium]
MNYLALQIRRLLWCLLPLVLILAAIPAIAGPVDCGSTPIRVGQFKLGYRYYVENGEEKGINKDIVEELRKRTGCRFVTQEMSFARIWADLASGDLDMSISGIRSPERDKSLWCASTIASKNYTVIRTALSAKIHSAEDFMSNEKLQFGVVRGYTHGVELDRWLETARKENRVEESASVDVLFEKLKAGRIDAIFSFPFVYRKILLDQKMEGDFVIQDWAPKDKGIIGCIMLNKNRFSENEAKRWQALVRKIHDDGTLKRIFNRYLPPHETEKLVDF